MISLEIRDQIKHLTLLLAGWVACDGLAAGNLSNESDVADIQVSNQSQLLVLELKMSSRWVDCSAAAAAAEFRKRFDDNTWSRSLLWWWKWVLTGIVLVGSALFDDVDQDLICC